MRGLSLVRPHWFNIHGYTGGTTALIFSGGSGAPLPRSVWLILHQIEHGAEALALVAVFLSALPIRAEAAFGEEIYYHGNNLRICFVGTHIGEFR